MAKIQFEDANFYQTTTGYSFFNLADNGDTAKVQFLLDDQRDIEVYANHRIETSNGFKVVNCLRNPNDPISNCPLCAVRHKIEIQLYLKLIDKTDNMLKIWTRGKTFYDKIATLSRRYKPLASHIFEIERIGKKGDMKTTYDFYEIGQDSNIKSKDDLLKNYTRDEINALNILGSIILDLTYEELEYYVKNGDLYTNDIKSTNNNASGVDLPLRRGREVKSSNTDEQVIF